MALPTTSIGSLKDLFSKKDQLTSGQVADVKRHLLNKGALPPTFLSHIASLRDLRSQDFLSETEHSTLLNDHIYAHVKKTKGRCLFSMYMCPGRGENDVSEFEGRS